MASVAAMADLFGRHVHFSYCDWIAAPAMSKSRSGPKRKRLNQYLTPGKQICFLMAPATEAKRSKIW